MTRIKMDSGHVNSLSFSEAISMKRQASLSVLLAASVVPLVLDASVVRGQQASGPQITKRESQKLNPDGTAIEGLGYSVPKVEVKTRAGGGQTIESQVVLQPRDHRFFIYELIVYPFGEDRDLQLPGLTPGATGPPVVFRTPRVADYAVAANKGGTYSFTYPTQLPKGKYLAWVRIQVGDGPSREDSLYERLAARSLEFDVR